MFRSWKDIESALIPVYCGHGQPIRSIRKICLHVYFYRAIRSSPSFVCVDAEYKYRYFYVNSGRLKSEVRYAFARWLFHSLCVSTVSGKRFVCRIEYYMSISGPVHCRGFLAFLKKLRLSNKLDFYWPFMALRLQANLE